MKQPPQIPQNPLEKIALCCSGGGYRASAFHLGTLSYLDYLYFEGTPLLHKVKTISTVSGGTITGMVYAQQLSEGKSFLEIYTFLYSVLANQDLIEEALEKIDNNNWKNPNKRKNLINAFAELYDKYYTQGATFKTLQNLPQSHLEEVIFNSTEFNNALNFRFQNKRTSGNYYNKVSKDLLKEIKLSDIIAASSCFPGGFEPIEFPNDFLYDRALHLKKLAGVDKNSSPKSQSVGLMDGGIFDNQGIDSILKSEDSHIVQKKTASYYDLVLISDVSSPYFKKFQFYEGKNSENQAWSFNTFQSRIKFFKNFTYVILILLLIVGCLVFGVYFEDSSFWKGVGVTTIGFSFFLLVLFFLAHIKVLRLIDSLRFFLNGQVEEFFQTKFQNWKIKNYSLAKLLPLSLDRLNSLKILVVEVFLKQIRRLQYEKIYENDNYTYRRISVLIKQLTKNDFELRRKREQRSNKKKYYFELDECPAELKGTYEDIVGRTENDLGSIVDKAAVFGTTLWFTPKDQVNNILDKLIITGQASTCFSILTYLIELIHTPNNGFQKLPKNKREVLIHLKEKCLADWNQFKKHPDFLTKQFSQIDLNKSA